MIRLKSSAGFTLPEAIVTVAITGIVVLGITSVYILENRLTRTELRVLQTQNDLAFGLTRLTPIIANADDIMTSAVLDGNTYTTSASELVLSTPAVDASNNIIEGSYDLLAVVRDGDGSVVVITDAVAGSSRADSTRIFVGETSSLVFEYENTTTATDSKWVNVKVQKVASLPRGARTFEQDAKVFLRNK
ncbi:MAG TPA: prepilin-type N-terminal cleavage/methylation domain-containing protein [Flavobacterium sp.]|nr:prepilin-type N-terminal cleavage/methylation domain-containing protein [Flavobacterium sp.]